MQLNHKTITVKNKHEEFYPPELCIVKRLGGVGEEVAVNAIGASFLAFFNTFNLRYIEIVSSHVNSFIRVSVASCIHKMHRASSVSLLETGGQLGQRRFEGRYPLLGKCSIN